MRLGYRRKGFIAPVLYWLLMVRCSMDKGFSAIPPQFLCSFWKGCLGSMKCRSIKHLSLLALALIGSLTASAQNTKQIPLPTSQNPSNADLPISGAVWARLPCARSKRGHLAGVGRIAVSARLLLLIVGAAWYSTL